jgi:hypothetical protein
MKQIPYHELPLIDDKQILITPISGFKYPDGRKITVLKVKDDDDFLVRITRKLDEESESLLQFRVTMESAEMIAICLLSALNFCKNGGSNE